MTQHRRSTPETDVPVSLTETPAVHVTHAATYASLAMVAQALVTLGLPYAGLSVPPLVQAAVVAVLVGGGTVLLHMKGIAVPGAPADFGVADLEQGLADVLEAVQTLQTQQKAQQQAEQRSERTEGGPEVARGSLRPPGL